MTRNRPRFSEESTEFVLVLAVAGVILFISGIWLAAITPDDAPWIGSLLNDIFASERGLGLGLLFLGVACGLLQAFSSLDFVSHDRDRRLPSRIPDEERARALAQRIFNPPYPPKPDWGQTLRGLGLFAALVAVIWYRAGAPPLGDHELKWLREGLDAYGSSMLILCGTVAAWSLLTALIRYHLDLRTMLEWPLSATWWLLRQIALIIGALVLALITSAGVSTFPA
jgi:hypothetical protein